MSFNPGNPAPPLAPDWAPVRTPDGKILYVNSKTNATTWEPPLSTIPPPPYDKPLPVPPQPASSPPHLTQNYVPTQGVQQGNGQSQPSITSFLGSAFKAAVSAATALPQMGSPGYGSFGYQPGSPYGSSPYPPTPNTDPSMSVPGSQTSGQIFVNGAPLDQMSVMRLQSMGLVVAPGRYW